MKFSCIPIAKLVVTSACILLTGYASYAQVSITFPTPSLVFQRDNQNQAVITVLGTYLPDADRVEARVVPVAAGQGAETNWSTLTGQLSQGYFSGTITASGGWYQLMVRAWRGNDVVASGQVEPVGIGEVFAIAGQSNGQGIDNRDALGAADQRVVCVPHLNKTDTIRFPLPMYSRTVTATGTIGPRGLTGWCWSRLGDRLAARFNIPVAFMNAAWSGTAVRNWRESITVDSTATSYSEYFRPGMPYGNLKRIVRDYMPLTGMRAVLWHQGEAEFYDTDPSAANYFTDLQTIIRQCRQDAGYDLTWVVARASMDNNLYANYGLTHYEPVVSAQNRIVQQVPNVFYGPDTDVIQMPRTDGVHFSGPGLIQLGDAWNDFLTDDFFRNTAPRLPQPATGTDLRLAMVVDRPAAVQNSIITVSATVVNDGAQAATNIRVRCDLPAGLQFIAGNGITCQRGRVLAPIPVVEAASARVLQFQVKPIQAGTYVVAGEISSAGQLDIDSRPNTSTGDGQDDMATVQFRVGSGPMYVSPLSVNADPLPLVASNQPAPIADQADISLTMLTDRVVATSGQPVSVSLLVRNGGGLTSGKIQVGVLLPDGLTFVSSSTMQPNGTIIRGSTGTIAAGSYDMVSFLVTSVKAGSFVLQAQVESGGGVPDPDSTPNNGFANGEDDCAHTSLRTN